MLNQEVILFFIATIKCLCYAEFVIPEVTLEAYRPKGFRASIPAVDGIQMFAFHGNINEDISQVDPGTYSQDFTSPEGNIWTYFNPDLQLKVGDSVNYWIFIQHQKLGYRKDKQVWKVKELVQLGNKPCRSISIASGKTHICKDSLLFEDNFNASSIDLSQWTIEQYIPTYHSYDYEFVSYQNKPDICYLSDDKLFIKPKAANSDREVSGELDFRGRCTRQIEEECFFKREIYLILPPVASGRLVSNFKFKYGKIEIRAKLPAGDWIYPQMYLEQVDDPRRKLWIGYARGNDHLVGTNQKDIGASLLFGGPVLKVSEPERSKYLRSKQNDKPFTSQMHTYAVIWSPDSIDLLVDGERYGEYDKEKVKEIAFSNSGLVRLVLGVGVGGVNDFPDDFKSGQNEKPWRDNDNKQVKKFFSAKDKWLSTWSDKSAFQVDYVKVWAL